MSKSNVSNPENSLSTEKQNSTSKAQSDQSQTKLQPLKLDAYTKKRIAFITTVLMQCLVLLAVLLPRVYTAQTGQIITLRTSPVDPWDMFRGDFVTLNFEQISALNISRDLQTNQEVFVVLQNLNGNWKSKLAYVKKPSAKRDEIVLKARVESQYPHHMYHLKYGLEKYYVPEGQGKKLEAAKHLHAEIAVDSFGNALVKNVKIE